jgi:hypothetical protein
MRGNMLVPTAHFKLTDSSKAFCMHGRDAPETSRRGWRYADKHWLLRASFFRMSSENRLSLR